MENLIKHLASLPRQFNSAMPVGTIGRIPAKASTVDRAFSSLNFSFILEGSGTYVYRGQTYQVEAPCVITQWPEEPMNYGPQPGKSWFELFLIYPPSTIPRAQERRFFSETCFMWSISNPRRILKLADELYSTLRRDTLNPDRIDYICEGMILESLFAHPSQPPERSESKIQAVKTIIEKNPAKRYDFSELAKRHGMSLSTFRRNWLKFNDLPPAKYQSSLLLREACRLLAETDLSISEIAATLNFDDQYYFSKKFHKETGLTPTIYRKRYTSTLLC